MNAKKAELVRRKRGFTRASTLVQSRIKAASETRGFQQSRVLTHWPDIVGPEIADKARPVNVSYGQSFGATLTLLTTGAHAPMLEMQKDTIIQKVNACYGYAAISRIRITQTAPVGFSEGQADFEHRPRQTERSEPEITSGVRRMAADVSDDGLRQALERLGANIKSRSSE